MSPRNPSLTPSTSSSATLTFTTSPLPLRAIASTQTAFLLWCLKLRTRPAGEIPTTQWFQRQNFTAKDIAPETLPVQELINPYIKSVGIDLKDWVEYHSERIFFDSPPQGVIWKSFDRLKFQHDGSLDYVTTSKSLINCNRLSRNDKYRLACCYCLEDTIRHMWPSFYINQYSGVSNNVSRSMIDFWSKKMLHELRGKGEKPKDVSTSAKRMLAIVYKYPRNWTAVEYFFNKLHSAEKLNHMIDLIDYNISYVIRLLPKLPNSQIREVMEQKGLTVWLKLSKQSEYMEYAIRTWHYMKDFTCQDSFYGMIKSIINQQLFQTQTKTNNRFAISLLYEIWITAPDHLKTNVVSSYISSIIRISFEPSDDIFKVINQDSRFFLAILSDTSVEFRSRLWDKYSFKMVISIPPEYLNQLFETCIGDNDQISEYKQKILSDSITYKKIKKNCVEWIKKEKYRYFDEFSAVFSLDKETTTKLKQEVLLSCDNLSHHIFRLNNKDKWHRFRKFVETCFEDVEICTAFKKYFAYSHPLRQDIYSALNQGRLQEVVYFLGLFLNNGDQIELKRDIFDDCHSNLIAARIYNFTAENWQKFFEWCLGSECEIAEFKVSAPINDIFALFLHKYVRFNSKYDTVDGITNQGENLIKLDNFLVWYFDSSELVKEYKLGKASNYNGTKSIKEVFQIEDERVIDTLVDWFFEGDESLIDTWNNPIPANIPSCMANVVRKLRKKWAYVTI